MAAQTYGAAPLMEKMLLWEDDSQVILQPSDTSAKGVGATGSCLVLDRAGSAVSAGNPPEGEKLKTPATVFGCIGVAQLPAGPYLIVVTAREQVAVLRGSAVWKVTGARVIPPAPSALARLGGRERAEASRFASLLEQAACMDGLYFSYGADLTLSTQRAAALDGKPGPSVMWERAEQGVFWNRRLSQPLIETKALDHFVLPIVCGFICQLPLQRIAGRDVSITLLARRHTGRCGTRYWRRGGDRTGNVANHVETEQLLVIDGGQAIASFVQVRGSIPLLWSQAPNIKYKPKLNICGSDESAPVFERHMRHLVQVYGPVVAVSLINQKGAEHKLGLAFGAHVERLGLGQLKYVPFDFHKQTGHSKYENISKLVDIIAADVDKHGYYVGGSALFSAGRLQGGVVRTNCIDCLDRTNVVQGWLARRSLESQMRALGILASGETIAGNLPSLEGMYKVLWADHGDIIAAQYTGTGALKSDYTRTGKRTFAGLLLDGKKAMQRYYLNNFYDGIKQDGMDLFTGEFDPTMDAASPQFKRGAGVLGGQVPVLVMVFGLLWAMRCFSAIVMSVAGAAAEGSLLELGRGGTEAAALLASGARGMAAGALAAAAVGAAVRVRGRSMVNTPQLCRDAVTSW